MIWLAWQRSQKRVVKKRSSQWSADEVEQLQRAKLVTLVEGSVLTLWIQSLCGCLTMYDT